MLTYKYACNRAMITSLRAHTLGNSPMALRKNLHNVLCEGPLRRVTQLPSLEAAVTSTFGWVLKIDSAMKVCRKLQGASVGMVTWATNVGNGRGPHHGVHRIRERRQT
ncbi:hypothetical protein NP493_87g02043 [Ridgeia piscesae]|uniref:DUF6729 domain-containing protein n=1 Tax=Ridgeia piscesae TaxID=27915 RepID=A0AAD9P8J4_RIDPI|nr:hypothetical protein NP493_87g02043 [Ridgeia piscesae]